MRVRTALGRALVSASALVAVVGGLAAPASAGTGPSTGCSDGVGFQELHLLTTPITLTAEINRGPFDTVQQIQLCYSTTPVGSPGPVGGRVQIRYDYWTTPDPAVRVTVQCLPDPGLLPLPCFEQAKVTLLPTTVPAHGFEPTCVVYNPLSGGCLLTAELPWVQLEPILLVESTLTPPLLLPPALCIDYTGGTCP